MLQANKMSKYWYQSQTINTGAGRLEKEKNDSLKKEQRRF